MRYSRQVEDESCGKVIPGSGAGRWAAYGGIVCLRNKDHEDKCIPTMRDAYKADNRCIDCYVRDGHLKTCIILRATISRYWRKRLDWRERFRKKLTMSVKEMLERCCLKDSRG